jgi:hypothetical protein
VSDEKVLLELIKDLHEAKVTAGLERPLLQRQVLGLHSALGTPAQLSSDYASRVREALAKALKQSSLNSVALMTLSGAANTWVFAGFDNIKMQAAGTMLASPKPVTNRIDTDADTANRQRIRVDASAPINTDAGFGALANTLNKDNVAFIRPFLTFPGRLNTVFSGGSVPFSEMMNGETDTGVDLTLTKSGYAMALRIQNPKFHTLTSVDCVSCHLAEATKRIINNFQPDPTQVTQGNLDEMQRNLKTVLSSPEANEATAQAIERLKPVTEEESIRDNVSPQGLRMFGWGDAPTISETVLEHAAVDFHQLKELIAPK